MQPVAREYEAELLAEGVIDQDRLAAMKTKIKTELESAYSNSKNVEFEAEQWASAEWLHTAEMGDNKSGVPLDRLRDVGEKISVLPADDGGKKFHRLIRKIFE